MDQTILNNLEIELRRGTQTLAVLSLLREKQYGYSLLQALEEKHVYIEAGTLYPMLRRLETQGLLTSHWDTQESRPRKYYELSSEGILVLDKLIEVYRDMTQHFSGLL